MKKTSTLFLFGLVFALSATAQTPQTHGLNGLVLDSTYTTTVDGMRYEKTVYMYNGNKEVTSVENYYYVDGSPLLSVISTYTYQNGYIKSIETFKKDQNSGQIVLTEREVCSEWDSNSGNPGIIMMYSLDEENPDAGLQLKGKQEIFYDDGLPLDYHLYTLSGDNQWVLTGKGHMQYNADGLLIYELAGMEFEMEGQTYFYQDESNYEYDPHGQLSKESTTTSISGMDMGTNTTMYENFYYDDGNLRMVGATFIPQDGNQQTRLIYYFWSDGNASLIRSIEAARKLTGIYFDLSGRQHQGTPTEKGIYIVEGKKIIIE